MKKTIFRKLNKFLEKDKLVIKPIYPNSVYPTAINLFDYDAINMFDWGLFKLTDYMCLYVWDTFDDMMFSEQNIFDIRETDISFCKGDSLEEIVLKLDLTGV